MDSAGHALNHAKLPWIMKKKKEMIIGIYSGKKIKERGASG